MSKQTISSPTRSYGSTANEIEADRTNSRISRAVKDANPKKQRTQNVVYVGKINSLENRQENLEITSSEVEAETVNGSRTIKCDCAMNRGYPLNSNCRYKNIVYRCKVISENRK